MDESILNTVKKALGVEVDYTEFDFDILIHINSVFSTLNQLGLGPTGGYYIEDETPVWSDFIGSDSRLNSVKTYVCLRVRMLFDPPATSFHISALNEQVKEFEWRLSTVREGDSWTDPNPATVV